MEKFTFFDQLRAYFEPGLIYFFLISALCYLIYRLTFAKNISQTYQALLTNSPAPIKRKVKKQLYYQSQEQSIRSFWQKLVFFFADLFWVLLVVVVLRSFVIEPFIIPSASMHPGLIEQDVVAVNKAAYGFAVPLTTIRFNKKSPKRGDVIVFKYPENEKISFIKRVVGLPGDRIQFNRKTLTVNGKAVPLELIRRDNPTRIKGVMGDVYREEFGNTTHGVQYIERRANNTPVDLIVPAGHYFAMGDNRDDSEDGRVWGFIPEANLIGQAYATILNFECFKGQGQCNRFFSGIQ